MAKAFEKQTKTIKDEGKKQVDALKDLKLENQIKSVEVIFSDVHERDEIKNELHKIKTYENKAIRDNLFYESSNQICDFKIFKAIQSFGKKYL